MKKSHLYVLLLVIKNNGDIRRLKREGIDYPEIAQLTNEAITSNFILYEENNIILTQLGNKKLEELGNHLKRTNKENWIEKEVESKIPKLNKNFIFLPNQNELDF